MIRAIRVEFAKPLDRTWDELGTLLHTQRKVIGQLTQAGVDALVACAVVGSEAVKGAIAPDAKAKSPQGLAYQAVKRELEIVREKGKWSETQNAALNISGSVLSSIGGKASSDYAAWKSAQYRRREAGQGKKGRASYGRPQPIPVPRGSDPEAPIWSLTKDEKGFVLDLKITSQGRVRVALKGTYGQHKQTLLDMLAGKIRSCDCKIVYDERKKKWYALLAYEAPEAAPVTVDPKRVLVVHRGMRNALTLLPSSGGRIIYESGAKFMYQRAALRRRMREARRISLVTLGDGAQGHGRARRSEHLEALDGKLARVTHTWCQQMAARVLQVARDNGCGLVIIEDYGGIQPDDEPYKRLLDHGPLYQLKAAIQHAVSREGMHLEEVKADWISTTCPACGSADLGQHNRRTGVFHCRVCGFERPADFVAALHMLQLSSADSGIWDERLRREQDLASAGRKKRKK